MYLRTSMNRKKNRFWSGPCPHPSMSVIKISSVNCPNILGRAETRGEADQGLLRNVTHAPAPLLFGILIEHQEKQGG